MNEFVKELQQAGASELTQDEKQPWIDKYHAIIDEENAANPFVKRKVKNEVRPNAARRRICSSAWTNMKIPCSHSCMI